MPALSMNCVEVLPELLRFFETQGKEGKRSTIRPAWKTAKMIDATTNEILNVSGYSDGNVTLNFMKKPRYTVGSICKIYWKQRTSPKGAYFCSICGAEIGDKGKVVNTCSHIGTSALDIGKSFMKGKTFPKLMGEVRITDVFKIEMRKEDPELKPFVLWVDGIYLAGMELVDLYENDGFKDHYDFLDYFNKTYDLTTPKQFYVYNYEFVRSYL